MIKHQIRMKVKVKIGSGLLEHLACTLRSCKSKRVLWMRFIIMGNIDEIKIRLIQRGGCLPSLHCMQMLHRLL